MDRELAARDKRDADLNALLDLIQRLHPTQVPSPTPHANVNSPQLDPSAYTSQSQDTFAIHGDPRTSNLMATFTPATAQKLVPGLTGRRDYTMEEVYSTATGKCFTFEESQEKSASHRGGSLYHLPDLKFSKWLEDDLELTLILAENWFRFYDLNDDRKRIQYLIHHMEGRGARWFKSKLRVDPHQRGNLFRDWEFFVDRLKEVYALPDQRFEAFGKIHRLRMNSNKAGKATEYVEEFRDLASLAHIDTPAHLIYLFRNGLTENLRRMFERDPPDSLWDWYREVESIDRDRALSEHGRRAKVASTFRPTQPTWSSRRKVRRQFSTPRQQERSI